MVAGEEGHSGGGQRGDGSYTQQEEVSAASSFLPPWPLSYNISVFFSKDGVHQSTEKLGAVREKSHWYFKSWKTQFLP